MTPALALAFGLAVTPTQDQSQASNPCLSPIAPTIELLNQLKHDGFIEIGKGNVGTTGKVVLHWLVGTQGTTKGDWVEILTEGESACISIMGTGWSSEANIPDAPLSPPTAVPAHPAPPAPGPLVNPDPSGPNISPEGETINL